MTDARRARLIVIICVLTCLAVSPAASAQQPRQVELTPFVGYQSKESFTDETTASTLKLDNAPSVGLIVDVDATPGSQYEFLYSQAKSSLAPERGGRTLTDVKVEYLHAGGLLVFGDDHVRPFFGATLGLSRFSPDASRMDSDTNFSLGLVGGVKFFLTRHVGLRFEARGFATATNGNSSAFCNSGTCKIFYDGNVLWQATANAGLVIAF
jgi:opacity protein-like surface antigen